MNLDRIHQLATLKDIRSIMRGAKNYDVIIWQPSKADYRLSKFLTFDPVPKEMLNELSDAVGTITKTIVNKHIKRLENGIQELVSKNKKN